ncbi:hypothetical protein CF335_g5446 [Tilletia laevis]|nr:hypothetical protein CF335_g5446 [Tilletia laevis]
MPQLLQLLQLAARNGAQQTTPHTPAQPPRSDGKFEAIFAALGGDTDAPHPYHGALPNSTSGLSPYLLQSQSPRTPLRSEHQQQGPFRAFPYCPLPAGAAPPSTPPPRNQFDFSHHPPVSPSPNVGLADPAFARAALSTPSSHCLFESSTNSAAAVAAAAAGGPASEADADGYVPMTKSVTRTAKSLWEQQQKKLRKAEETAANEKESQQIDSQKLDNSKNVVLEQLTTEVKKIKIGDGFNNRDRRVSVKGWVHRLRQQSNITFLVLRGGHRYMQCVLTGKLAETYDAITLTLEPRYDQGSA